MVNIYFDDGFVYLWEQHEHYTLDVQPDGTPLFKGFYLEDEDGDEFKGKVVKHGKTVDNKVFAAVKAKAQADMKWASA